jgi:putative acetyltransferase
MVKIVIFTETNNEKLKMALKVILREIEEKDNPVLAKIIREVFVEHDAPRTGTVFSDPTTDNLYQLFRAPGSTLWIAEVNGKVIGCCGVYHTEGLDDDCAELMKFYLLKEGRGKGIGRKLMQKAVVSARKSGFRKLYLESMPQFSNAIRIYEKQGFKKLGHPLGNSGHVSCNIWMIKEL